MPPITHIIVLMGIVVLILVVLYALVRIYSHMNPSETDTEAAAATVPTRNPGSSDQRKRGKGRISRKVLAASLVAKCRVIADDDSDDTDSERNSHDDCNECPICLSELSEPIAGPDGKSEDNWLSKLPCGHTFHEECIVGGWVKKGRGLRCPICNYDLVSLTISEDKEPNNGAKAEAKEDSTVEQVDGPELTNIGSAPERTGTPEQTDAPAPTNVGNDVGPHQLMTVVVL